MMLHSWRFLCGFLPIIVSLTIGLRQLFQRRRLVAPFLIGASLLFAAAPGVDNLLLLLGSTLFNYLVACWIRVRTHRDLLARWALGVGIAVNIAVLAYFKYLDFLIDNVNGLLGMSYPPQSVGLLPLGLSFLTFQQIAYLVDSYQKQRCQEGIRFSHYLLFCSFFPAQVAGPILRAHEFIPQIATLSQSTSRVALVEGLTRFVYGYFEKVVMADTLSRYSTPVFDAVVDGRPLGFVAAWGGLLAFTFQLYFDFSGYSNMAIGVARMVGFTLPENFASPYHTVSVSDFWRRWHMTLSRFLRDYLYIPLGGNKKGLARQVINIMVTMVLGGLWHGASWTFVIWGALHGCYRGVNHGWRGLGWRCSDRMGWFLTFLSVAYAWVWFRADSTVAALRLSASLVGVQGVWSEGMWEAFRTLQQPLPGELSAIAQSLGLLNVPLTYGQWTIYPVGVLLSDPSVHLNCLVLAAVMVWVLPNAQEWLELDRRRIDARWPAFAGALIALVLFVSMLVSLHEPTSSVVYSKF